MRYRVTSILFEEHELLSEYPILKNYNPEKIVTSLINGCYSYLEIFITIPDLDDLNVIIQNVGCVILDKDVITIYDGELD